MKHPFFFPKLRFPASRFVTSAALIFLPLSLFAGSKHSASSRFQSYEGKVMCGYQGWFRTPEDGAGRRWVHYGGGGQFDEEHVSIDLWPDVSEYENTYPTSFKMQDGTAAHVFSSWDQSTVDLHYRWMADYGIDGAFMQRFFPVTRTESTRRKGRVILGHALTAAKKHGRAMAVMYDLSGLRDEGEDCSSVIQDWKELVDELKVTSQGDDQSYLYHRGKPLVAIWGLGFPDRGYNIRHIGIEKLIDFLKNDPEYGGCSVMLGVPTYFRSLSADTVPDPYLHEIMAMADVMMPWMVGRFSAQLYGENRRYAAQVAADLAWCKERNLDYVPCVYPGFSWYNLTKGRDALDAIPRLKGRLYWGLMTGVAEAGAKMVYVAMFDEVDEATAIFKFSNEAPVTGPGVKFLANQGVPNDHYLWLTGQGGKLLRGEIEPDPNLYLRTDPKTRDQPGGP